MINLKLKKTIKLKPDHKKATLALKADSLASAYEKAHKLKAEVSEDEEMARARLLELLDAEGETDDSGKVSIQGNNFRVGYSSLQGKDTFDVEKLRKVIPKQYHSVFIPHYTLDENALLALFDAGKLNKKLLKGAVIPGTERGKRIFVEKR